MDFEFYHIDTDTTVNDLVTTQLAIFAGFKDNTQALLNYTDTGNDVPRSNYDRIIERYSQAELTAEAVHIQTHQLDIVKAGTVLLLPKGAIDMALTVLTGRNLFIKDIASFNAFYGAYLDLLKRDGFTPAFKNVTNDQSIDIREYQISVWVWSRAYSQNGTKLLDITKFVETLTTNVNGIQNSFSINLQAINDNPVEVGDEMLNQINIDTDNKNHSVWDFVQPTTSISERLPMPWFKKILQQNDIVFIRYERLTLETTEDRLPTNSLEVPATNLPGKVFDMIALIDKVTHRLVTGNTDMSVNITGRDLTKLLIEDGSYFFPLLFTENSETLFFNTQDDSKWFKRTFIKNTFDYLFLYKMQSVRDSLGFVVNQLANLGACNDTLFSSYDDKGNGGIEGAGQGGRRTQALQLTGQKHDQPTWNAVSGIWQIVDLLIDTQIEDRRIANSQISNPNGNLMSVVESFCQKPFVEFFGDTYGDKFTFIARTPPYTKNAILSVLNGGYYIDIDPRDVEDLDVDWDTTFYTWFEMDPRNMFLGRSDSIALAYLPVVYFPEIAEAFGNKQMKITDNYISNQAFTGTDGSENRDQFKQKVIEDFLFAIESYCNLPFTECGTITIRRDRRLKAKTWVKFGPQFFYIESLSNNFLTINERVDGTTTLNVARGMYIDYIRGTFVQALGREIDYWSIVKLDVIRKTLIQKLQVLSPAQAAAAGAVANALGTHDSVTASVSKNTVKVSFGTDKDAFDYFLQRKFLP
jgi:hypothetical protein